MTLIETLVALAIIFIVFFGLLETSLLVLEHNMNNVSRDEGVSVTERNLEWLRNQGYATLYAQPRDVPINFPGNPYQRQIRGLSIDYNGWYQISELNANALQVLVNFTWQRNAWKPGGRELRTYNHQATTIVRDRS